MPEGGRPYLLRSPAARCALRAAALRLPRSLVGKMGPAVRGCAYPRSSVGGLRTTGGGVLDRLLRKRGAAAPRAQRAAGERSKIGTLFPQRSLDLRIVPLQPERYPPRPCRASSSCTVRT